VVILAAVVLGISLLTSKGRIGELRRPATVRGRVTAHAAAVAGAEPALANPVTFDDVALAVMRKAWHDYDIGYVADDGVWIARHIDDSLAPMLPAASPEELTAMLSNDASDRRREGRQRRQPDEASSAATACSAA
jgi:hypothetical protein